MVIDMLSIVTVFIRISRVHSDLICEIVCQAFKAVKEVFSFSTLLKFGYNIVNALVAQPQQKTKVNNLPQRQQNRDSGYVPR